MEKEVRGRSRSTISLPKTLLSLEFMILSEQFESITFGDKFTVIRFFSKLVGFLGVLDTIKITMIPKK